MKTSHGWGVQLRKHREARGVTLHRVQEDIKVPLAYLRALEEEDYAQLPAFPFSSGFLASYCRYLNLPPEPYVAKLRRGMLQFEAKQQRASSESKAASYLPFGLPTLPGLPDRWFEIAAWATVCAILVLCWMFYAMFIQPLGQGPARPVQAGSVEIQVPKPPDMDF